MKTPRRLNLGLNFEACGGADGKKFAKNHPPRGHTETEIEFSHGLLDFCTQSGGSTYTWRGHLRAKF